MWSFVRGGMTPLEALQAATSVPAMALGFKDIGTPEPGKLADLVILDADPLADIRNSDDVDKVMLNGRLYDAATLAEEVRSEEHTSALQSLMRISYAVSCLNNKHT